MTPGLIGTIREDLHAKAEWMYGGTSASNTLKVILTDGTFAMITFRLMQWCQAHRLVPLAMIFNKCNVILGGCIIGRGATFGGGSC